MRKERERGGEDMQMVLKEGEGNIEREGEISNWVL